MIEQKLLIAKGEKDIYLIPKMANRHGLIAGATGTGKTISLQVMAEAFSSIGVPVFLADVKGDLSGICQEGISKPKIEERIKSLGLLDFSYREYPAAFWDVFGEEGHPVRTTISDMGPLLLSRLLNLNDTQSGVLNIVFKIADDKGMMLLDLKDLKAMLNYVGENSKEYTTEYGNISKQTIGAIQRGLLTLQEQGADKFFGEPALDIMDLIRTERNGMGVINILEADKLFNSPALYSTFLLWLLAELYENLPEVGDAEKPKIVFFFDEAHLLFNDAPRVLLEKIEQVVRLIRSKGVGIYFVTQNPIDIPDTVLGQLGNRVQHALRAFTPRDQKAVKSAAETFRQNPKIDVASTITELSVGEALISFLEQNGSPSIVERAFVLPPQSFIGPVSPEKKNEIINKSLFSGKYDDMIDRISAYEKIQRQNEQKNYDLERKKFEEEQRRYEEEQKKRYEKEYRRQYDNEENYRDRRYDNEPKKKGRTPDTIFEKVAKSAVSSAATSVGRQIGGQIIRGILGSLLKK